jgi:predicted dienelactone hydrolase
MACIVPWATFLPVPKLTKPSGQYRVGTSIFRWVDPHRAEHITPEMHDKRNVVVQAWYPAVGNGSASHSHYLDGLHKLPENIGFIPRWVFDHYDQINTHGTLNAQISKAQNQWPVIIFLTGNGASRAFYTSLVAGLASHGYVVLAIDHPYEAMITQLADGNIVSSIEKHPAGDPNLFNFMKGRLDLRIADVTFVLNQLENPVASSDNFLSSLDKNRIVIAGHSLGGASAAVAMTIDLRIKAAANIDGTLYGELPEPKVAKPFLLIESKKDSSERFQRYENGNRKFFNHFGGGYRYEITEADHYSFTDAPLLLAFPARIFANRFLEFGSIPAKTHDATVEILNAFFRGALNEDSSDLDLFVKRYQGIIQKPIE